MALNTSCGIHHGHLVGTIGIISLFRLYVDEECGELDPNGQKSATSAVLCLELNSIELPF